MLMILHQQFFHPVSPSVLCLFPKGDRKLLFEQQMQPRRPNTFSSNHYWEGQCWEPMPFANERMRKTETQHLHTHCPGEYWLVHLSETQACASHSHLLCCPSAGERKKLGIMLCEFNPLLHQNYKRMCQKMLKWDPMESLHCRICCVGRDPSGSSTPIELWPHKIFPYGGK